jgi:transposase
MNRTSEQLEALSSLLDLEELEVLDASQDRPGKVRRFVVVPRVAAGLCPHCHQVCEERHECHERRVLDLPLGAYATQLTVRLFQYRCRSCDKFFTPHLACLAEGAHATERFLKRLSELVKHTDLANAAAFLGVAPKTLEHWYYDYVKRQERAEQDVRPVRSLGIDELSLKKDTANSASC